MPTARFFLICLWAGAASIAAAQTLHSQSALAAVRVDHSFVPLDGPWKFEPGDSPKTDASPAAVSDLLWASPAFDDSGWTNMDLHAPSGQIDSGYGTPEYLKGWTAKGFPHLQGYAWYRIRIHIADPAQRLALKMPDHFDDAYQVFANGKYLGEFGHFTPDRVDCYRSRPLTFALPPPDAHGDLVLALRFFMEPYVFVGGTTADSGGMHQAPLIGLPSQIEEIRARERTGRMLSVIVSVFVSILLLIAAAGALWIWLIDRSRRTFLWLTLGLALLAIPSLITTIGFFTYVLRQGTVVDVNETAGLFGLACWVLFWREWFNLSGSRFHTGLPLALASLCALIQVGMHSNSHVPVSWIALGMGVVAVCKFAVGILLFVTLLEGARRDRAAALIALPPILLLTVSLFGQELISWAHIRTSVFLHGIQISVNAVALAFLALVTGALAVRRFIGSQVSQRLERQTIDQEFEQARELQRRVLVPETNTSALFAVETAYHPARTVGGDFFQVIANPDGSLLVVVGDVSGKGMAPAMLVAVLVGAIRTRADDTSDPAEILRTLNDRLLGRAGSHFATCIAAHIKPGGAMVVANAGHIPPYRNGLALDLPGALPLGILPDSRFDVQTVQLAPGDYITFLTDGVLEARDAAGELLGFDETARLSSMQPEAIAQAAILHGQDDDITVVGVRVGGAPAPAHIAPAENIAVPTA